MEKSHPAVGGEVCQRKPSSGHCELFATSPYTQPCRCLAKMFRFLAITAVLHTLQELRADRPVAVPSRAEMHGGDWPLLSRTSKVN